MSEDIISYVTAAAQGDTDAMAKLYAKTLKSSYYLALKLSNDSEEAAVITKNAYARVFCTISRLKKPEAFEIYMRQNVAAVYKESQKFTFSDASSDTVESSLEFLSEDVYEDEKKSALALAAVAALSPETRSAVVLHYYSGMPVGPLAKYLNVSESTVNAVLAGAKKSIFEKSGSSDPYTVSADVYPVLNRIFKRHAEKVVIEPAVVREMFAYIMDRYKTYKKAESLNSAPDVPAKNKFFSAADFERETETEIETETEDLSYTDVDLSLFAPDNIDDNAAAQAPEEKNFLKNTLTKVKSIDLSKVKNITKKYNPKFLMVCGGAVALLLILIIIVCAVAGNKQKKAGVDVKWNDTGFEEFTDITYINEYFCSFKYNNQYGLMDYQGNILVQPAYDSQFVNCGYGRDYDESDGGSGKYHVYVMVNGVKMSVNYSAGKVDISQAHGDHSQETNALPDGFKYEERDRYFEGYAAAENSKGKWGYIDKDGKTVIPFDYYPVNASENSGNLTKDYCRPVTNGYVAVKDSEGMMAIINMDNELVTDFEYTDIMPGSNGIFIAKKDGKWGTILVGDAVASAGSIDPVVVTTAAPVVTDENGEPVTSAVSDSDVAGKHFKVTSDGVNIRKTPGSRGTWIGDATPGTILTGVAVEKASNGKDWLKIEFNGGYGYVFMQFVEQVD